MPNNFGSVGHLQRMQCLETEMDVDDLSIITEENHKGMMSNLLKVKVRTAVAVIIALRQCDSSLVAATQHRYEERTIRHWSWPGVSRRDQDKRTEVQTWVKVRRIPLVCCEIWAMQWTTDDEGINHQEKWETESHLEDFLSKFFWVVRQSLAGKNSGHWKWRVGKPWKLWKPFCNAKKLSKDFAKSPWAIWICQNSCLFQDGMQAQWQVFCHHDPHLSLIW